MVHDDGDVAAATVVAVTNAIRTTTRTATPSASVAAAGDVAVVVAAAAVSMPTLASSDYLEASFHRQSRAFDIPLYPICQICTVDKDPTSSAAWDETAETGKAQGV